MATMRPFFSDSNCSDRDTPLCRLTEEIFLIASKTMFAVSLPEATATFITGAWFGTMEPNTVIKIMGNNIEKTIEVGLRSVASKLYFERVRAALNWFTRWLMFG